MFRPVKSRTGLLLSVLCLAGGCGFGRAERETLFTEVPAPVADTERVEAATRRLEHLIQIHYSRRQFHSFAVGVFDRRGFVYSSYVRSSSDKRYSTGSVTKLLTATLFQILREKQRLQPHVAIDRYTPEFKELRWNDQPVTLQHLVTHTGGFPDLRFYKDADLRHMESIDVPVPMPIYPPGRHYRYSNHGYMMLGHILAQICKTSLENCVKREIFDPLGMHGSSGPTSGAGGFMTTMHDLMLFGRMYLNGGTAGGQQILSRKSIAEMVQPGFYSPPSEHNYYTGRGWRVKTDRKGVVTMFHIGGANYISAWLQLYPQSGLGVCYLGDPPEYNDSLMSFLTGVQYHLGSVVAAYANTSHPMEEWRPDQPHPQLAEQFPGLYLEPRTGETLTVYREERSGTARLMVKSTSAYEVFPATHHIYLGGRDFLTHQFIVDPEANRVIGLANGFGYYVKQAESASRSEADGSALLER